MKQIIPELISVAKTQRLDANFCTKSVFLELNKSVTSPFGATYCRIILNRRLFSLQAVVFNYGSKQISLTKFVDGKLEEAEDVQK